MAVARAAKAAGVPVILDLGGDATPPPAELLECLRCKRGGAGDLEAALQATRLVQPNSREHQRLKRARGLKGNKYVSLLELLPAAPS